MSSKLANCSFFAARTHKRVLSINRRSTTQIIATSELICQSAEQTQRRELNVGGKSGRTLATRGTHSLEPHFPFHQLVQVLGMQGASIAAFHTPRGHEPSARDDASALARRSLNGLPPIARRTSAHRQRPAASVRHQQVRRTLPGHTLLLICKPRTG